MYNIKEVVRNLERMVSDVAYFYYLCYFIILIQTSISCILI